MSEVEAIRSVIDVAESTGAHVHIVHVSAAEALPLVREAKERGVRVSAETCPHYLTFAAEAIPGGATEYKCAPPIRAASNRELLWQGLQSGVIDCIATDHAPCTPEMRHGGGNFTEAWAGINSLQVALSAVWTGACARGIGIGEVSRWMSAQPAALTGLADKGSIAVGKRADLVAFDPTATYTLSGADLVTRHKDSPYVGMELTGAVRTTWVGGVEVTDTPAGRLIGRP